MAIIQIFRNLIVYQKAFKLAMDIFEATKSFPKEELYSLTDQIRRSSRSITSNLEEVWAKKIHIKSFINKISDALAGEYETEVWLDFALQCGYIPKEQHQDLINGYDEVRKILISMVHHPDKFCKPNS